MKIGYVVLAHKRPDLIFRLVERLGVSPVAIHIDKKSDIFPEVEKYASGMSSVTLLRRHTCHWSLFGHVAATLEGMRWASAADCDYTFLLTGQCYPLKTQSQIRSEVEALEGKSVIRHLPLPRAGWTNGGFDRVDRVHFRLLGKLKSVRRPKRKPPAGLRLYGGFSYWCLSRACVRHVLSTLDSDPSIRRYFHRTHAPDEMIFHSILASSELASSLIDEAPHYVDWTGGGAHPKLLATEDVKPALASGRWFARKFEDQAVLDVIDAAIERGDMTMARVPGVG
jgi:hypothetical protein